MDEELVSLGYFSFNATEDELVWQYTTPVSTGIRYKSGKARLYKNSPDKEQETENSRIEEKIAKLIAEHIITWVSFDVEKILHTYYVTVNSNSPLVLQLEPKTISPTNPIQGFIVTFAHNGIDVNNIIFHEQNDDYTRLDFFNSEHQ